MNSLHTHSARALRRLSDTLDRHPALAVILLVLLYVPTALRQSAQTPLNHDEIFTGLLSGSSTLFALWHDSRAFDLNPPLGYLLARAAEHGLGTGALSLRLPEMAGFLMLLLCVFRFVRLRMGAAFALLAASLLMGGTLFELATLARPYSLLLGSLGLALVGWQLASVDAPGLPGQPPTGPAHVPGESLAHVPGESPGRPLLHRPGRRVPGRRSGLLLLAAGVFGMVTSHVFSLLLVAVLVLAELWRQRLAHRADWPALAAMLLPCLYVLTYAPMLRSHGGEIFPPSFQPDGVMVFDFYLFQVERELVVLCLAALLALVLLGPWRLTARAGWTANPAAVERPWFFTAAEWVALIGLMASPLVLIASLELSHGAFFFRYGAQAGVGFAVLTAALLGRWTSAAGVASAEGAPAEGRLAERPLAETPRAERTSAEATPTRVAPAARTFPGQRLNGGAALLAAVLALTVSGVLPEWPAALAASLRTHGEPTPLPCGSCLRTSASGLPLVDASGLTFVEMGHYEPASTMRRVFYLTDPQGSTAYAHANIFERMGELVQHFHLSGQVQPFPAFVAAHPRFFVLGRYDYPEDWLLRKLIADGATVQVRGRVSDSYRDTELYEVELSPHAQPAR